MDLQPRFYSCKPRSLCKSLYTPLACLKQSELVEFKFFFSTSGYFKVPLIKTSNIFSSCIHTFLKLYVIWVIINHKVLTVVTNFAHSISELFFRLFGNSNKRFLKKLNKFFPLIKSSSFPFSIWGIYIPVIYHSKWVWIQILLTQSLLVNSFRDTYLNWIAYH